MCLPHKPTVETSNALSVLVEDIGKKIKNEKKKKRKKEKKIKRKSLGIILRHGRRVLLFTRSFK